MNGFSGNGCLVATCALAAIMLTGCVAPKPKDFNGKWVPVNRFSMTANPIPLRQPYTYFASPLDATLKTLLERWARDTGMRVDYRFGDDFTLYTPVSGIHTTDVASALAQLNSIYARQDVSITVNRGAFVIDARPPSASPAPESVPPAAVPSPPLAPHSADATSHDAG